MSTSPSDLDRSEIRNAVREVIGEMFGIPPDEIAPGDRLVEDLDLDSMDAVDLVVDLKLRTGVKLVESDIKSVETIQDVIDVTYEKIH